MSTTTPRSSLSGRQGVSTPTSPPKTVISRGGTARSAVSPRVNSLNGLSRRPSSRASVGSVPTPPPASDVDRNIREELAAALKRETEEKEEVCLFLQRLSPENHN